MLNLIWFGYDLYTYVKLYMYLYCSFFQMSLLKGKNVQLYILNN